MQKGENTNRSSIMTDGEEKKKKMKRSSRLHQTFVQYSLNGVCTQMMCVWLFAVIVTQNSNGSDSLVIYLEKKKYTLFLSLQWCDWSHWNVVSVCNSFPSMCSFYSVWKTEMKKKRKRMENVWHSEWKILVA